MTAPLQRLKHVHDATSSSPKLQAPQCLACLHQLYDKSESNTFKNPLVQPFDNGMELPTPPFEWTVAHEAEDWQWLLADHGVVTVGGQQFEYAYTSLALQEDTILTAQWLRAQGLDEAPKRAAVLLWPLLPQQGCPHNYVEAFNRGSNEALDLLFCSWCPAQTQVRVTTSAGAWTAPKGAKYS
jgi:hypothetical protein